MACTKTRNNETKRPKRNHRNERNERNETTGTTKTSETSETAETKPPKRPKRAKINEKVKKIRLILCDIVTPQILAGPVKMNEHKQGEHEGIEKKLHIFHILNGILAKTRIIIF